MKTGPKPKPTAALRLAGSRRAAERNEPAIPAGPPLDPPSWISAEARKEWDRIIPILERAGIVATTDLAVCAVYCETWAEYRSLVRLIRAHGRITKTEGGALKRNPASQLLNETRSSLVRICAELGLSPSSRVRVPPAREKRDPAEAAAETKFFGSRA